MFNYRYISGTVIFALLCVGALAAANRYYPMSSIAMASLVAGVLAVGGLWSWLAGERDRLGRVGALPLPDADKLIGKVYRRGKQLVVFIIGGSMLIIGLAMIALPGPAIVMIPLSLIVLGTEFAWAKRLLEQIEKRFPKISRAENNAANKPAPSPSG